MGDLELSRRIARGRTDLVFDLVASGGDLRAPVAGASPMAWCAYYGDVSGLRKLMEAGIDLAGLGPNLDLNGAAFHQHWRLCQFLIEQGADAAFALEDTGETPLHVALSRVGDLAQERVVEVLLAAGATPAAMTRRGAPTGAFARDVRTCAETALHRAAAYATPATVARLLAAGADPAVRDAHGDTPLTWASRHLRPSTVIRLLLHGDHRLHPDADWSGDHGQGLSRMDQGLVGQP